MGIPRSIYNKFETGAQEPMVSMSRKIVDLFDVDANYLLGRTEISEKKQYYDLVSGDLVKGLENLEAVLWRSRNECKKFGN
jgi:transcriptional regulator with XRE-family HTH domain